jgi:hypothetical protein
MYSLLDCNTWLQTKEKKLDCKKGLEMQEALAGLVFRDNMTHTRDTVYSGRRD